MFTLPRHSSTASSADSVLTSRRINGLAIETDHDADRFHDLVFSPGSFVNAAGSKFFELQTAMTKRFDEDFAAGTAKGGKGVGMSEPADGTIHYHAITDDTTDALDFCWTDDPSGGAAIPTGWTWQRRVGSFVTDASRNIIQGRLDSDGVFTKLYVSRDFTTASNYDSPEYVEYISLSVPSGIRVKPILRVLAQTDSAVCQVFMGPGYMAAAKLTLMALIAQSPGAAAGDSENTIAGPIYESNTSGQLAFQFITSGGTAQIWTLGWKDPR